MVGPGKTVLIAAEHGRLLVDIATRLLPPLEELQLGLDAR